MTLACEDAYSKLVEVDTVADVSDKDHVGNSLMQIWKLSLVIMLNFCFDFGQDFEVEVRRNFETEVWSVFCC